MMAVAGQPGNYRGERSGLIDCGTYRLAPVATAGAGVGSHVRSRGSALG